MNHGSGHRITKRLPRPLRTPRLEGGSHGSDDPADAIQREELLDIIRMLPDVIFRCEKREDGKIYWTFNEGKLAAQFHLTTKEIQGKSLEELFPGGASEQIKQHFEAAFRGEVNEFVNELEGRHFKHFPQPVRDDEGNVIAVVGFISEVTELTLAEREVRELSGQLANRVDELSQANQELEMFNHMLSHDLNNSLAVIRMKCELVRRSMKEAGDEESGRTISQIQDVASRMSRLFEDFRDLSRTGRQSLVHQTVDLSETARQVATEMARGSKRHVDVRVLPGLKATGDPALLRVLLENLIGNAWKYSEHVPHPHIIVDAVIEQEGLWYRVRDNGIGFETGDSELLFEPFHRAPNAKGFPGSGIGLATAARIVERHGGRIKADGRPGEGATFSFNLSASAAVPHGE